MTVELENKQKFIEILDGYRPSNSALEVLREMPLVIMLGVTASGRNTIINHLVNSGKYHFVLSDTTRPPKVRDGKMEENGIHYNFRNEIDVLKDLQAGNFLEAELIHNQQVSGISIAELQRASKSNKIPVNEVDFGGVKAIKMLKADTNFFFVVPPSYKEWLYRLQGREIMSQIELANRMTTAKKILREALEDNTFTFVVNDSSHASAELIDTIVNDEKHNYNDKPARGIAQHILNEL